MWCGAGSRTCWPAGPRIGQSGLARVAATPVEPFPHRGFPPWEFESPWASYCSCMQHTIRCTGRRLQPRPTPVAQSSPLGRLGVTTLHPRVSIGFVGYRPADDLGALTRMSPPEHHSEGEQDAERDEDEHYQRIHGAPFMRGLPAW